MLSCSIVPRADRLLSAPSHMCVMAFDYEQPTHLPLEHRCYAHADDVPRMVVVRCASSGRLSARAAIPLAIAHSDLRISVAQLPPMLASVSRKTATRGERSCFLSSLHDNRLHLVRDWLYPGIRSLTQPLAQQPPNIVHARRLRHHLLLLLPLLPQLHIL